MVYRRKQYKRPLTRRGRKPLMMPAMLQAAAPYIVPAGRAAVAAGSRLLSRRAVYGGVAGAGAVSLGVNSRVIKKRIPGGPTITRIRPKPRQVSYRGQAEMNQPIKHTLTVAPQYSLTPFERRLQKISTNRRIIRWQAVNPLNRVTGSNDLPGWTTLANNVTATYTAVPMHLINLTNTVNNSTTTNGPVLRTFVESNGDLTFGHWSGRQVGTSNVLATDWQNEYNDNFASQSTGFRYIQPKWIDVRFNLYGAKSQPTIYDIQVVKFSDDYLDPLENPSNTKEADDRRCFWQGLVRPFMYNPILPNESGSFIKKKLKVIHRTRVTIQPTLSTELDVTPASQIVKFFIKDGRVYDYMYHGNGFSGTDADNKMNTDMWEVDPDSVADYSENPQAKARYWIIIRALNTTPTTDGVNQTSLNTPSYDLVIRKKELIPAEKA